MNPADIFRTATQLHQAGRFTEAAALYDQFLALTPDHAEALHLRGAVELQQGRYDAAVPWFERTVALKPDHASAHSNLAAAFIALGQQENAARAAERALALNPNSLSALKNRASALNDLGRYDQALPVIVRAVELAPADFQANLFLTATLLGLERRAEALAACEKTLVLKPNVVEALRLRAVLAGDLKSPEDAIAAYDAALRAEPNLPIFPGELMDRRMKICDWKGFEAQRTAVLNRIDAGQYASNPFYLLSVPCRPDQQKRAAALHAQGFAGDVTRERQAPRINAGGKLRIGYFSSDFGDHALGHVVRPLIELHDKERFEVLGFSLAGERNTPGRALFIEAFSRVIDLAGKSVDEIAAIARGEALDVAIDLNGYTQGARSRAFAMGLAPIQVNYLGYAGTLGSAAYDYIFGDAIVTPFAHRDHFSERIVQLPHSFFVGNDSKRLAVTRHYTRAEVGLPEAGFVFCGFNNHFKITPDLFDVWMRILSQVEGSVLWLSEGMEPGRRNLKREARARGVAPERLVFAPRIVGANFLARQQLADLFLDTFHYNAHSTACDALMMGLPVLTRLGETFASRVGTSLVTAAGLPELAVADSANYESTAVLLARDRTLLASMRRRLEKSGPSSPLFDTRSTARNIERAYAEMAHRSREGLPAQEFAVAEA